MQDVLTTIAADQDAIIRADAHHPLLVDGGPGTGKTVVALHRAAYLLYADTRLSRAGAEVLVLGPHEPYLAYIADVLPSLGEEGVRTSTPDALVPESAVARPEPDAEVARLKGSLALVAAIEPAVAFYEEPPTERVEVETAWGEVTVTATDWADVFAAVSSSTVSGAMPHNEARDQLWSELAEIVGAHLLDDLDPDEAETVDAERVERDLRRDEALTELLHRSWPLIDATDLVGDLWEVPAYLRRCAPGLTPAERGLLRREDPSAWTLADLPLLDAARARLGDPDAAGRQARRRRAQEAARAEMDLVVDHLIETDDSEMHLMSMLRGQDLRGALADDGADDGAGPVGALGLAPPSGTGAELAGPFAHIVVDEAQELTDAQWAMVLRRCPSRSLTIVGDRAQARAGFTESWAERLARVGLDRVAQAQLTVNYRTPAEVMTRAEAVIRAALPDANVPTSIRQTGIPVRQARLSELGLVLTDWMVRYAEGTAAVIGLASGVARPPLPDGSADRVAWLTPQTAKGLEFDLVVLCNPEAFGSGLAGAVDRYVAMTRTTRELVILTPG